ncbi:MAG: RCC1 domain-containing protein [Polyangiaceae bacterium]
MPSPLPPVLDPKLRTLPIPGIADAVEVAIERSTVCFRRRSGKIACARHVGADTFNDGFSQTAGKLTEVPDVRDAVQIAANVGQFCAARKSGAVVCFNADGFPLPNGVWSRSPPSSLWRRGGGCLGGEGRSFLCALLSSGKVACKGDNYFGALGAGDFERHSQPVLVKGMEDAVSVTAGDSHVCVARKTGHVACWGRNDADAAGHPDPAITIAPVEVKGVLR